MRNLRKVLALALVLCMVFAVAASAANFVPKKFADDDKFTTELGRTASYVLQGLGIVNGVGDGTSFDPAAALTREQFVAAAYRLTTGQTAEEAAASALAFVNLGILKDVAGRWGEGYAGYFASNGIVTGNSQGFFNPTGEILGVDAAKVLLGIIGYKNGKVNGFVGENYATNVMSKAQVAQLTKGVNLSKPLTREGMAILFYNCLLAQMVEQNVITINGVDTLLGTEFQYSDIAKKRVLTVGGTIYDMNNSVGLVIANDTFTINEGSYTITTKAGTSWIADMDASGAYGDVYYNKYNLSDYAASQLGVTLDWDLMGEVVRVISIDTGAEGLDRFDTILAVIPDADMANRANASAKGARKDIVKDKKLNGSADFLIDEAYINFMLADGNPAIDDDKIDDILGTDPDNTHYARIDQFLNANYIAKTDEVKVIDIDCGNNYDVLMARAWRYGTVDSIDEDDEVVTFGEYLMTPVSEIYEFADEYDFDDIANFDVLKEDGFYGFLPNAAAGTVEFKELETITATISRWYSDDKATLSAEGTFEAIFGGATGYSPFEDVNAGDEINVTLDVTGTYATLVELSEAGGGSAQPKVALVYTIGTAGWTQANPDDFASDPKEVTAKVKMVLSDGTSYTGSVYVKNADAYDPESTDTDGDDDGDPQDASDPDNTPFLNSLIYIQDDPDDAVVVAYKKDGDKYYLSAVTYDATGLDVGVYNYNANLGKFLNTGDGNIAPASNAAIFVAQYNDTGVVTWKAVATSALTKNYTSADTTVSAVWPTIVDQAQSYWNKAGDKLLIAIAGLDKGKSATDTEDTNLYGYVSKAGEIKDGAVVWFNGANGDTDAYYDIKSGEKVFTNLEFEYVRLEKDGDTYKAIVLDNTSANVEEYAADSEIEITSGYAYIDGDEYAFADGKSSGKVFKIATDDACSAISTSVANKMSENNDGIVILLKNDKVVGLYIYAPAP